MATVAPAALPRRKKQAVYGKSVRKTYSVNHDFLDDDEPVAAPVAKRAKPSSGVLSRPVEVSKAKTSVSAEVVKSVSPVRRTGALPKATKSPAKSADPFDIPSSDDEHAHTIEYAPAPLRLVSKSRLVKEPTETTPMASWERRAARVKGTASGDTTGADSGSEKQITREVGKTTVPDDVKPKHAATSTDATNATLRSQQFDGAVLNDRSAVVATGSALDRLAARRPTAKTNARSTSAGTAQSVLAPVKRSTPEPNTQELPLGKRRRVVTADKPNEPLTGESDSTITYEARRSKKNPHAPKADIFDVPIEIDEKVSPAMRISPKLAFKQRSRLPARSTRFSSPKTSVSAPERLAEMLPSDEDAHVPIHESPERSGRLVTPPTALRAAPRANLTRSSSTSRSQPSSTPQTTDALTPKQTQMWADFFEAADNPNLSTPVAPLRKLSIVEKANIAGIEAKPPKAVSKARPDAARRRTRAVDRLKALAVSSSEEDSSEDEDEDMNDAENTSAVSVSQASTGRNPGTQLSQTTQTNQSQEKPYTATEGGPRITYAKARSHLAEESLDNMILDLPMDTPQRPAATARRVGKPVGVAKKSAFDLEDSEEDAAGRKGVRTIHDLRAAGRNTRVMGEISDLLQEVADHSTSARSRRRSALLELATKLLDKAFAEQFLAHGFEYQLIAECKAPREPVFDFILSTAYTLLSSVELSVHTTRSFETVLPWLARFFPESTEITKLAKERRSNMSKAAQSDVAGFQQKVKTSHLWNAVTPLALSSRLMALKATDSLIGKLRGLGDKSELLDTDALSTLVPKGGIFVALDNNPDAQLQAAITVSILEALSTLSAVGNWPASVIQAVASLPSAFASTWQAAPHTKWLAYRLCLNLTNDPAINQGFFTDTFAVRHLLSDIVSGFASLHQSASSSDAEQQEQESSALHLDLLVLAIGILTNLAEHNTLARAQAIDASSLLALRSIIGTFRAGQERLLDAASEEESTANVAFGYLAVMLANVCQDAEARVVVAGLLPGGRLDVLIEAVEEFVRHHRKVDEVGFEGVEGKEVWGRFTERLVGVLERLKRGVDEG